MPRNQGTSRKGKPKKGERAAGMGRALTRSQQQRGSRRSGEGGMSMVQGMTSIGIVEEDQRGSVLEVDDLTDFLQQANMAGREFESEKQYNVVVDSAATSLAAPRVKWQDLEVEPAMKFEELSLPRRPKWNKDMTAQELNEAENKAFLEWRRGIAQREEQVLFSATTPTAVMTTVTPFEKNLEIWRQLWRVVERSIVLVQIVDARNPIFYLSRDLQNYVETEMGKRMVVLLNKADYLSVGQRNAWSLYLSKNGWGNHVFFSAHAEQVKLDQRDSTNQYEGKMNIFNQEASGGTTPQEGSWPPDPGKQNEQSTKTLDTTRQDSAQNDPTFQGEQATEEGDDNLGIETPLSRGELLYWLYKFAASQQLLDSDHNVEIGMVGFPNVGKSSVINVLMQASKHTHGVARVGVAAQPGKTKHFQTLVLPSPPFGDDVATQKIVLVDCPGLVFPSFCSSTADLIAAGVYPISQMRANHMTVVQLICERIPKAVLEAVYGIAFDESAAEDFLNAYCTARGLLAASSGAPDYYRASRVIIADYVSGKLLYCHAPPGLEDGTASLSRHDYQYETFLTSLERTKKLQAKIQTATIQPKEYAQVVEEIDDFDMLKMVQDEQHSQQTQGKRGKKHKTRHKHGKKGRKDRNKDPYNCHSEPDLMSQPSSSNGVIVRAGKYGRNNYTRANNYGGVKSAVEYNMKMTKQVSD